MEIWRIGGWLKTENAFVSEIYGKHGRGSLKFRNKIESFVVSFSPRCDSAAADG
jgi:hypothetical protein